MSRPSNVLSPEEHKRVFDERIVPESGIEDLKATDPPRAIILAGQPGAGKGGLANASLKEMEGNAIIIDTDACRDAHPNVAEFRKVHPYDWGDDTHPDASKWAKELLTKAIDEKKNFVFDTTLSDGPKAVELIDRLQKAGYQVEVRAIATSKIESELGVDQRFTNSFDEKGFGRFVPEKVRDEIYNGLPKSLDTVHADRPDVPISIYNREREKLYDSTVDNGDPGKALVDARNQRYANPDILQAVHSGWSAQQAWHAEFVQRLQGIDEKFQVTNVNLMREREQHGVVDLVNRNVDASFRYLSEVAPEVAKAIKADAAKQDAPKQDAPDLQQVNESQVKPKGP